MKKILFLLSLYFLSIGFAFGQQPIEIQKVDNNTIDNSRIKFAVNVII